MNALEQLRQRLPESARDIRSNLRKTMQSEVLSASQIWGVALTVAIALRSRPLRRAILVDAQKYVKPEVLEDARTAAILMRMNYVYYRFRHSVDREIYQSMPAGLRMAGMAKPKSHRKNFELFCLAASVVQSCNRDIQMHEQAAIQAGLSPEHIHDAVRIAATLAATAVALDM